MSLAVSFRRSVSQGKAVVWMSNMKKRHKAVCLVHYVILSGEKYVHWVPCAVCDQRLIQSTILWGEQMSFRWAKKQINICFCSMLITVQRLADSMLLFCLLLKMLFQSMDFMSGKLSIGVLQDQVSWSGSMLLASRTSTLSGMAEPEFRSRGHLQGCWVVGFPGRMQYTDKGTWGRVLCSMTTKNNSLRKTGIRWAPERTNVSGCLKKWQKSSQESIPRNSHLCKGGNVAD